MILTRALYHLIKQLQTQYMQVEWNVEVYTYMSATVNGCGNGEMLTV